MRETRACMRPFRVAPPLASLVYAIWQSRQSAAPGCAQTPFRNHASPSVPGILHRCSVLVLMLLGAACHIDSHIAAGISLYKP